MKITLLTLVLFIGSLISLSADVVDRIGQKDSISFANTTFNLKWSDKPRDNYYIQEYLPANEELASFKQMLTIHLFVTDLAVNSFVDLKVNELIERKKTDLYCKYQVTKNPKGDEFIIDCLMSDGKNNSLAVIEFIAYRCKQIDLGDNKKGILVFSYSNRGYSEEIPKFFENLEEARNTYLKTMIEKEMPIIKLVKE